MTPFTEYYRLLAFARTADGDFSYFWYDVRFTECLRWEGVKRKYICVNAKQYSAVFEEAKPW